MSPSFTSENKKFISTKEASELSGYTSDYIGQISRTGKIESRMVGRTRFVEEKNFRAFVAAAGKKKVPDAGIKRFLSTKEASELSGYTSDYIGQISRTGKVESKMVGRTRFVEEKSFRAFVAASGKKGVQFSAVPSVSVFEETSAVPVAERTTEDVVRPLSELPQKTEPEYRFEKKTSHAAALVYSMLVFLCAASFALNPSRARDTYSMLAEVPDAVLAFVEHPADATRTLVRGTRAVLENGFVRQTAGAAAQEATLSQRIRTAIRSWLGITDPARVVIDVPLFLSPTTTTQIVTQGTVQGPAQTTETRVVTNTVLHSVSGVTLLDLAHAVAGLRAELLPKIRIAALSPQSHSGSDDNTLRIEDGSDGYLLQSTGSGIQWVATSSLGITGGGAADGSFSTTSADYYISASSTIARAGNADLGDVLYWNGVSWQGLATSSLNIIGLADGAFSTTSADYWLTLQSVGGFSTTSADYWTTVRNFFSTTSADYWLTLQSVGGFSTTSADYWQSVRNFFSTTSSDYWKSVTDMFSTTSANAFINASTTIANASGVASGNVLQWNGTRWVSVATTTLGFTDTNEWTDAGSFDYNLENVYVGTSTEVVNQPLFVVGTSSSLFYIASSTGYVGINKSNADATLEVGGIISADSGVYVGYTAGVSPFSSVSLTSNRVGLTSTGQVTWSNDTSRSTATADTGFARSAAGILRVTNGSSGGGALLANYYNATSTDATSTFSGNLYLTGRLADSTGTGGDSGMVLQTTGTGITWVSTSTLNITGAADGSFSTTSADYWKSVNNFFSTTSSDYWKSVTDMFSTTSANAFINASTTIANASGVASGNVLQWNGTRWVSVATTTLGFPTSQWTTSGSNIYFPSGLSAGNVGIGTTSPYAKLSIHANNTDGLSMLFAVATSTLTATTTLFQIARDGSVTLRAPQVDYAVAATSTVLNNSAFAWTIATSTTGTPIFRIDTTTGSATKATTTITGGFVVDGGAISYDYDSAITSIEALNIGNISFDDDAGTVQWINLPVVNAVANTPESYTAYLDSVPVLTIYGLANGSGATTNNRVGIGTTSPWGKLSVAAGHTDGNGPLFVVSTSTLTGTTTAFIIDRLGNVGIGTTTPTGKLSIHAGATDGLTTLFSVATSTLTATTTVFAIDYRGTTTVSGGLKVGSYLYDTSSGTAGINGMVLQTTGTGVAWVSTSSLNIAGTGDGSFSTTSADYWKSVSNFFSTTSSDYWASVTNLFSTTSSDYWKSVNNFFSTTSSDYWASVTNLFSTTSANAFINASTTIAAAGNASYGNVMTWDGSKWVSTATSSLGLASPGEYVQSPLPPSMLYKPASPSSNNCEFDYGINSCSGWSYDGSYSVGTVDPSVQVNTYIRDATSWPGWQLFQGDSDIGATALQAVTRSHTPASTEQWVFRVMSTGGVNATNEARSGICYRASGDANESVCLGYHNASGAERYELYCENNGVVSVGGAINTTTVPVEDLVFILIKNADVYEAYLQQTIGGFGESTTGARLGTCTKTGVTTFDTMSYITSSANEALTPITGVDFIRYYASETFALLNPAPANAGQGIISAGLEGQVAYYPEAGTTTITGTANLIIASTTGYIGIGTTSPYAKLSVAGQVVGAYFTATTTATSTLPTLSITGLLYDGAGTGGTSGMVLQTTGTGVAWVSTSSLNISGTAWDAIVDPSGNGAIALASTEQTMDWNFTTTDHDGLTFNFVNAGGTAGTDSGLVVNNAVSTAGLGGDLTTENLLLLQQLDTTISGAATPVDNFIKIDVAGDAGAVDGLEITNSGGDFTGSGINFIDTAGGTFSTGITLSGTFGTGINMGGSSLISAGMSGIGTSSPFAKLSVHGNASDSLQTLFAVATSTLTSTSTAFVVDRTGNVGVGTTTPWRGLSVVGTVGFSSTLSVESGSDDYLCIDPITYEITNGGADCGGSSMRFKENVADLSYGLDELMLLRPVSFNYKEEFNPDTSVRIGLIAEEVALVIPEVVSLDKDGAPQGVDYNKLVSLLIKAVQELSAKVDMLLASVVQGVDGVVSGIRKLIVQEEFCIGATCVNETQLQQLLESANITPTPPVEEPASVEEPPVDGTATSTPPAEEPPIEEPPVEESPAEEPPAEEPPIVEEPPVVGEPAPEPAPEPTPEPVL